MRQPLAGRVPKIVTSDIEKSLGAPVGGLNSRDPLSAMSKSDALILDNFICRPTSVEVRKGQVDFVTGFAVNEKIWSLMAFRSPPTDRMFAGTDLGIYDVTATGVVGSKVADSTNGKWESINGANAGIRYLLMVNGTDPMKLYNGTAWTNAVVTGIDSTTKFTNICQFKFRVFLAEKDSLSFWYLGVNAVQGAAAEFPLAPIFSKGGSLLSIGTWTIDGGSGADDYAVFLTTEGELAVYKGTDPSNATNWALVGVYSVPRPIGRKCLMKYGGDVLIITEQGVVMLSKILQSVGVERQASLSDKVIGGMQKAAALYKGNTGWAMATLATESILLLNVPVTQGVTSQQYVMNTLTGAWTMFKGMNALCFLEMGARLFYGTTGKVVQALTTNSDFGNNILVSAMTSFSNYGYPLKVKQVNLLQPNFIASKPLLVNLAIAVNYERAIFRSAGGLAPNNQAIFDFSNWDEAAWGGSTFVDASWRSVAHKPGYVLAMMLQVNDKDYTFEWNSTNLLLAVGNAL